MKKEIFVAVISSIITAVLVFIGTSSLERYKIRVEDSQVQEVAELIVNENKYTNVILNKMADSGKFVGKKGDQGRILAMITVKDKKIIDSTEGVKYDSNTGIVTFDNPESL